MIVGNKSDHRTKNDVLSPLVDWVPVQPHKEACKLPPSETAASLQGLLVADTRVFFNDDEQVAVAVEHSLTHTQKTLESGIDDECAEAIKQSLLSVNKSGSTS